MRGARKIDDLFYEKVREWVPESLTLTVDSERGLGNVHRVRVMKGLVTYREYVLEWCDDHVLVQPIRFAPLPPDAEESAARVGRYSWRTSDLTRLAEAIGRVGPDDVNAV